MLRYIPNTDHSLRNSDAPLNLLAWLQSILNNRPRPRFSWQIAKDGSIRVKALDKPDEVKLWQATNASARDFRLEKIGATYKATVLTASKNGEYVATVAKPEKGFTAYFVELSYPGAAKYPLKVTTEIRVTPNIYPFPPPKLSPPR